MAMSTADLPCRLHDRPGCEECTAAWFENNWKRLLKAWAANYEAELQAECQDAHDRTLEEMDMTVADHRDWTQPHQSTRSNKI